MTSSLMQDRIREALLRKAGLTPAQTDQALAAERETGQTLDQVLVGNNLLPESKTLRFFAEFLGMEWRETLEGVNVPSRFIQQVSVQFSRTHGLIAIGE